MSNEYDDMVYNEDTGEWEENWEEFESNEPVTEWWNREDKNSIGIPYTIKNNEGIFEHEYDEEEKRDYIIKSTLRDGTEREYYRNSGL